MLSIHYCLQDIITSKWKDFRTTYEVLMVGSVMQTLSFKQSTGNLSLSLSCPKESSSACPGSSHHDRPLKSWVKCMLSPISYSHSLKSLISIENEYQTSGVVAMAFLVADKWDGCCGVPSDRQVEWML